MRNELIKSSLSTIPVHIGYGVSSLDCPSVCPLHYHDEIELLATVHGEQRIWIDEKEYLLRAGDVAFINSRVPHKTESEPPHFESILLQFRLEAFQSDPIGGRAMRHLARFVDGADDHRIRIFRHQNGEVELLRYLIQIRDEYESKQPFYEDYLRGCIYFVLGFLYRSGLLLHVEQRFLHNAAIEKVMPALIFVDDHYTENLTLSQLSELCNVSEGYFCRQFKSATGSTLMEYLNFVRIYNAEKLLIRTTRPILEISMEVGFSSVSYFNRIFRRFKGCSPNHYRQAQYLRENTDIRNI